MVKGLEPRDRDNFLLWQEDRQPNVVIEVTSKTTRDEDLDDKFEIYRDKIQVAEYFLFDPRSEYLRPLLQGYRLEAGQYLPIEPVAGRLPSVEMGFHLERHEGQLRLFDPATGQWLPTVEEAWEQADAQRQQAEAQCAALNPVQTGARSRGTGALGNSTRLCLRWASARSWRQ